MKPSQSWLGNIPRERRSALFAVVILLLLLGSLMVYQRKNLVSPAPQDPGPTLVEPRSLTPSAGTDTKGHADLAAAAKVGPTEPPKQLMSPLSGEHKLLQGYAVTYSQTFGDFRLNPGLDFAANSGDAVLAAAAGKVVGITTDSMDGQVVTVDHGGGMLTRYAGVGKVLVMSDATVPAGSILAEVGNPGPARSNLGTHLHFEVVLNGQTVDPRPYLSK